MPEIIIPANLTFQTLLLYVLYILVILVLPVLVKYLIPVAQVWVKAKLAEMENKYAAKKLGEAVDIVLQAVSETTQTFVSTLKDKGEFTAENARIAFEKSKSLAIELMSTEVIDYIRKTYNDLDLWLDSKIEQMVLEGKTVDVVEVVPIAEAEVE